MARDGAVRRGLRTQPMGRRADAQRPDARRRGAAVRSPIRCAAPKRVCATMRANDDQLLREAAAICSRSL